MMVVFRGSWLFMLMDGSRMIGRSNAKSVIGELK